MAKSELRQVFLAGVFTLLPAIVLLALFAWVYRVLKNIFSPVLTVVGLQQNIFFLILIICFSILLILLIGIIVRTKGGKGTVHIIETWMLNLIPGYKQVKKVTNSFRGEELQKNASSVVLIDVFQNGNYMTGFITDKPTSTITTVFVPSGPNPTTGMVYHVRNDLIKPTSATTQEAFESILSLGKHSSVLFNEKSPKKKK